MNINMKSDLVDIEVRVVYETVDAYLVDHGGNANVWLPKPVAEFYSEDGSFTGVVTLPEWLAKEKELI